MGSRLKWVGGYERNAAGTGESCDNMGMRQFIENEVQRRLVAGQLEEA
jgi:hypothetical protein